MNGRILVSLGLVTGLSAAPCLWAQTSATAPGSVVELEEVIVTAERRSADVQKTAASVTVRSGEDLSRQGRFSLQQILEDVPNVATPVPLVAAANTDSPGGNIVIRGVQPNNGAAGNSTVQTTAAYTDSVYGGIGGDFDIDRVEVLRGPQGTLYGRSATSGVVSTYTHDPDLGKFGGAGMAEVGNYDLRHAWAAINLPVGDTFAVRVAGNKYQRDGYVSEEGGKIDTASAKVKLLYKPNEDFSLLIGLAQQDNHRNSGGTNVVQSSPGVIVKSPLPVATAEDHFKQAWANINWNLGFGTLTYIPAIRTWTKNAPGVISGPFGLQLDQLVLVPSDRFWTHEVRLASNSTSPLTWLVGALYYDNKIANSEIATVHVTNTTIFSTMVRKETKDTGAFGEATYALTDTWRVTGGLRYDKTKIEGAEDYTAGSNPFGLAPVPNVATVSTVGGEAGKRNYNNFTFKARVEKDLTPSNLAYATISTGFLPGDVQTTTVQNPTNPQQSVAGAVAFDQEKLTAYELGSKNRFLADTLQINGDVFYYRYSGYQTLASLDPRIANIGFLPVTAPAKMYGLELDAAYLITQRDRVRASYAYLSAKFTDKPAAFAQLVANDDIARTPANTFTGSYEHTFKLGDSSLVLHGDERYVSGYYSANYHPLYVTGGCGPAPAYAQSCLPFSHIDSQWIGNISATWNSPSGNVGVTGYVRNVANNGYIAGGNLSGYGASFASSTLFYDPRTYGVALNVQF